VRLATETAGQGPELVLLHGWGMNAGVWAGLPAAITAGRRVTAIDLPGHGASPFDPAWADRAGWAQACLDAAPARAVWLGWSLGGLIALEAALRAPERVAALVLLTATPRFVRAPDWPAAVVPGTLAQFHDTLLADPALTLDRFLVLQLRGSEAARETLRTLRAELATRPPPNPDALDLGLNLLREGDLRERLAALACPTRWIFGARDTLVPAAAGEGIAARLPGAQIDVIPGAAHAPFLSHPRQTAALVAPFLEEMAR
jgi:pimeloyl-[acyl-carrier protein] methyl ester esterase